MIMNADNWGQVSIWQTFSKKTHKPTNPTPSKLSQENMEMTDDLSRDNEFPGWSHVCTTIKLKVGQSSS